MIITERSVRFVVRSKRSWAEIAVSDEGLKVLNCSNRERCASMGITNCPPFCDKICALKIYLRSGRVRKGYDIRLSKL